jgi:hypothetical protein
MSESDTSSTGSETPTVETPATGTPASDGVTPQTKPATTTLEEALARIAELEHSHKNAREQADRHAKKLTAYEKAEQEAKDAQLSELDRAKKQHADLQSERDALATELQESRVHQAVERYANKLNFVVPAEMVARLIEWTDIEYENGRPTNVEKLLEKLAKSAPDLVKKQSAEPDATPPARGSGTPALPAMNPGRSSIAAPSSVPPGKPVKLSDVPWSR